MDGNQLGGNRNARARRPRARRNHASALGAARAGLDASSSVAGRAPDAPSTASAAACLGAEPSLVSDAGRGASLVIVATPDRAIEAAARARRAVARARRARDPPRGLARARRVRGDARGSSRRAGRRDASVAVVPVARRSGVERLRGAWAAVAGDPQTAELALTLGMRPFELPDSERAQYHAAAVVASNHLVALLGQVERLARGVRRAVRGVRAAGAVVGRRTRSASVPRARSPARSRAATSRRSSSTSRRSIRASATPTGRLAREVARLTGRRDHALDRLLDDVRHADRRGRRRRRRLTPGPPGAAPLGQRRPGCAYHDEVPVPPVRTREGRNRAR